MVEAGAAAGADCVLIETMSDLYEVKAAVLAAKERASLPVYVTMTFDETGKLLTGGSLEAAVAVLEGRGGWTLWASTAGWGPKQMLGLTGRALSAFLPAGDCEPQRGATHPAGGQDLL